jgi:hypothetical protein
MHPDIWRGQSALDRALELDEPRREALLADVRLDNPTMASMLEALLRDYERLVSDRLLDTSIEIEPPVELAPGQTVGAYTLEAPLGSVGWVPSGAPAAATAATKAGVHGSRPGTRRGQGAACRCHLDRCADDTPRLRRGEAYGRHSGNGRAAVRVDYRVKEPSYNCLKRCLVRPPAASCEFRP